jgi:hypothetical protein
MDVWPPEEDRHLWQYIPCPAKTIPLVGWDHLMHIWENPHHADRETYQAWQKRTSRFKRALEWIRHLPAPSSKPLAVSQCTRTFTAGIASRRFDLDEPTPPRSAYIFVKILKKVGDILEPNYGDQAPEGWGILFEEGFKVYRLLLVILLFYFLGSIAFIIWVIHIFGVISPSTWSGFFALLSWLTSFLALLLTVWFKWAENA